MKMPEVLKQELLMNIALAELHPADCHFVEYESITSNFLIFF